MSRLKWLTVGQVGWQDAKGNADPVEYEGVQDEVFIPAVEAKYDSDSTISHGLYVNFYPLLITGRKWKATNQVLAHYRASDQNAQVTNEASEAEAVRGSSSK